MNTPTASRGTLRNTRSITRVAAVAAATAVVSLTFSAPANAQFVPSPNAAASASSTSAPAADSSGPAWGQIALGVSGGAAVIGLGVVVVGRRRHLGQVPHSAS